MHNAIFGAIFDAIEGAHENIVRNVIIGHLMVIGLLLALGLVGRPRLHTECQRPKPITARAKTKRSKRPAFAGLHR